MDKFKMELTWHNCKTCPPKEDFNPMLVYTDGTSFSWGVYYKEYGFSMNENELHNYWWADIKQTIKESPEFKELNT